MALVEYEKVYEPDKWMWITEGNTSSTGAYFSWALREFHGAGDTNVYVYDIDRFADPEDHAKQRLITLNNGVYAELEYYCEPDSSTSSTGTRVYGIVYYKDKNGREISSIPSTGVNVYIDSRAYDVTGSTVPLKYISSYLNYNDNGEIPDEGVTGAYFAYFGIVAGENSYIGIWDTPPLGSVMEYADFVKYYNYTQLAGVYNWGEFDAVLEGIVNAGDGKPIAKIDPEDDTSGTGDYDPDYDPTSDPIGFPGLPTGGDAISTGFVKVYKPTSAQLQALARKLWSDDFVETIKKIQNDPMEALISLHTLPFTPPTGANASCQLGNYDSEVSMPTITSQWVKLNMGSIRIPRHWSSALDFSPYVHTEIFLPFIGIKSILVDDVIGKTINLEYAVDVLSGVGLCNIMCGNSVLYTYECNLSSKIPVTSSSYGAYYSSLVQSMGNILTGASMAGTAGAVGGALASAVNVTLSKKHSVNRSGNISGPAGVMGHFTPYIIIHRPKQSLASGFRHFKGYPSNITASISSVTGYTEVESVHLTNVPGTDAELEEIRALLYNGVIV